MDFYAEQDGFEEMQKIEKKKQELKDLENLIHTTVNIFAKENLSF